MGGKNACFFASHKGGTQFNSAVCLMQAENKAKPATATDETHSQRTAVITQTALFPYTPPYINNGLV
jgi:hypothetical protein